MEETKKIYWKGIEELTNDAEFVKYAEKEFPHYLPIKDSYGDNESAEPTRRDFLKLMGFSVAAVSLAACETPVKKAIPWLNKPESVDPSISNYYASTFLDGSDYCSVVVKARDGRPIFIEGNTFSNVTKGGISATATASIMSLYDIEKAKAPSKGGKETDWATIDKEITDQLLQIAQAGGQIRIVSNTIMSPSTQGVINEFIAKYPTTKHVSYDQVSAHGILQANAQQFGKAMIPSYHFDKAETIVTFGADFLGTWISPVEYAKQFNATRKIGKDKKTMSRLYAFESIMSITGATADYRTPIKPSQEGLAVAKLYNLIAQKAGKATVQVSDVKVPYLEAAADKLWSTKGKSLVVSGSNDVNVQLMVNAINEMLESYGSTIDTAVPSFQKRGNDAEMAAFVKEVESGAVQAVIFLNANPVYDHPMGVSLEAALKGKKVQLTVGISDRLNETTSLCGYHAPDSHFLESWNDAEPKKGHFSLGQPAIAHIFNTRQAQQSLLTWAGSTTDYYTFIRNFWKANLFKLQNKETEFESFWNRSLHNGVFEPAELGGYTSVFEKSAAAGAVDMNAVAAQVEANYKAGNAMELVIYQKVAIGTGTQANNPYLHETPDPISKACWGNYISIPVSLATQLGFSQKEGKTQMGKLTVGKHTVELPVLIQPGQAKETVAVAIGFGRKDAGKVATEAGGANAYPLASMLGDAVRFANLKDVKLEKVEERVRLAQTQTHETFMGRESIIQETILAEYVKNPKAGRYEPMIATYKGTERPTDISMWDIRGDGYGKKSGELTDYEKTLWENRKEALGVSSGAADIHVYANHHWGMAIDLNSCTGCSACVVACHIENNVPIVGKKEIINRREMHWIRIDRYYSSDGAPKDYDALEIASENPEVVFQPMMCQHCNNAPCETVCPVAATTHSSEGLNQMTYNRCVGTKYCANNCPYKVRRFNWFRYHQNNEFDYHMNNDLGRMVLNPDVTVRSRGVMEKCSLCVQRIQSGKLKARSEQRRPVDGEINTACASACPSDAIVFGDLNDPSSRISKLLDNEVKERAYNVLSEISTKPNVYYLTKVRNKDKAQA
ncbi:TAT-variant-translocated molybdopterin oxidoreductase [Rhodoflexus caldus]|uniref:TAT-variant-translocated molybdopterin oxidoreductase n=1 Tax=Rhodoflexus caldus TaxID=2891236 RepID=UPI00202AC254|nr:TAT-variant-translocated molybdopterin oxidoreductase [Rhodoflexus caldus]